VEGVKTFFIQLGLWSIVKMRSSLKLLRVVVFYHYW